MNYHRDKLHVDIRNPQLAETVFKKLGSMHTGFPRGIDLTQSLRLGDFGAFAVIAGFLAIFRVL